MSVLQRLSPICFNGGKPLPKRQLHKSAYRECKGVVCSQMTCSAISRVAGAYACAKSNKRRITKPFNFQSECLDFLIGKVGRDANFVLSGKLSLWTVDGRKRYSFRVPDKFKDIFESCIEKDSLTIFKRNGKLRASLCVTIEVPDEQGVLPVGIDLNETNAIVAVDSDSRTFFESGKAYKVRNKRSRKTRKRIQSKFDTKKAQKKDTRSLRRLLKRLSHKRSNRTTEFCRQTAKKFVDWVRPNSVLVFESLKGLSKKKKGFNKSLNRRICEWPRSELLQRIKNKAELRGIPIVEINPAYTSQTCSRCGQLGNRERHNFSCSCGHTQHADINAAINIRTKYAEGRKANSGR